MNDTSRIDIVTVDLAKPLQREKYGALLATGDENANRFGANIVRNGACVDLTGCTVSGSFIRADGVTVPLEGTAEGNTVHVDLTAQCYAVDGAFSLALRISGEDYAQTIRMVEGYIRRTDTGKYIDPDETVYNTEELKAVMKELDGMENPGSADTMLEGTEMIGADGKKVTGAIPIRTGNDLNSSGTSVSVPPGYYAVGYGRSVEMISVPKPTITIDENGVITSKVTFRQSGGVSAGEVENTRPLIVKDGGTITPTTKNQVAINKGWYPADNIIVAGDENLVADNIKSGVSIFGVEGSYEGEAAKFATGTFTPADASPYTTPTTVEVGFRPKTVMAYISHKGTTGRFRTTSTSMQSVNSDFVILLWCEAENITHAAKACANISIPSGSAYGECFLQNNFTETTMQIAPTDNGFTITSSVEAANLVAGEYSYIAIG